MIAALLIERVRRRRAEDASRRRLIEMAQMNRSLTVSAMSNSITHELNQPLGAILNNVSAAQLLLAKDPPDLDEIRDILADIRKDDERAAEIIAHLRGFLRKDGPPVREIDVNHAIGDVLHIVEPEAARRGIAIDCDRAAQQLSVRADHVHLQQVLLNLALNGMDAMQDTTRNRRMVFQTVQRTDTEVEVAVLDSGTGIPENKSSRHLRVVRDHQAARHGPRPFDRPHHCRDVRRQDLGRESAEGRGGDPVRSAAGQNRGLIGGSCKNFPKRPPPTRFERIAPGAISLMRVVPDGADADERRAASDPRRWQRSRRW